MNRFIFTLAALSCAFLFAVEPEVIHLSDRPKPLRVEVPKRAGGFYVKKVNGREIRIKTSPPVVKPANIQYNIKNFSSDDSLSVPLDSIVSIMPDQLGRLWFGTYGVSLSLYDGRSFSSLTIAEGLAAPTVLATAKAQNGNIWLATLGGGINLFDGAELLNFTTKNGLGNNNVHAILVDKKGRTWFGTEGGVSLLESTSFTNFTETQGLPRNTIVTISEDGRGDIWFGSNGGGLIRFDGKVFKTFTTKDGLLDNNILSSLADSRGNLWIGTPKGVTLYNGQIFSAFPQNDSLPGQAISALFQDSSNRMWFGTENGASMWDGKSFVPISMKEGLAADDVRAIGEDRSGGIWIATYSGGPSRFDGNFLSWFNSSHGLSIGPIFAIAEEHEGSLWLSHGNGGGLDHYDGQSFTNYSTAQGLVSNNLRTALFDHAKNLWLSSREGLSKYDGKSFTTYTTDQGLVNNNVYDVLEDKKGNLWFATLGGVSRFDGKTFTNYRSEQGLFDNQVNAMFEDSKGRIWFFHWYSAGVSRFDGKNFSTNTGLRNAGAAFEDSEGNIWFASLDRLVRFDGQSYLDFTVADGLPDNFVLGIRAVERKNEKQDLVIGTNQGLAFLTGFNKVNSNENVAAQNGLKNSELKKDYTPVFEIYNVNTGYLIKDVSSMGRTMTVDSGRKLWIATAYAKTSLVRLDFSALRKTNKAPELQIQSVKIDNQNIVWNILLNKNNPSYENQNSSALIIEEMRTFARPLAANERRAIVQKFGDVDFSGLEKFYPVPKNLILPFGHNDISISFIAIETAKPNNVFYQYKLEGFDKDFVPPTKNTFANYGNIHEGTYRFKVKAQSPNGVWSEPISYTFIVLPPWYRTWWAYLVYGASTLSFLLFIYRWRTAALRKRQRFLEVLYEAAERFVPKAFLSLLGKQNIQDVKLGDSIETSLTVLFTDIRGYTTLSEKLKPSESYAFINSYWEVTAPIIDEHKGFISQYLGDGVMALFPGHPDDAIEAVLDMIDSLEAFNSGQSKKGGHQIRVGYSLSTGQAILGTIGVKKRMDANVISNTSNLASRVESLNKYYGTQFLITDLTLNALSDFKKYTTRQVDKIKAKGMKNTVRLVEVYRRGPISENERSFIDTYEAAFRSYEKGDFASALADFKKCLILKPEDHSTAVLIERCESLKDRGTPGGWDGAFEMMQK